MFPKNSIKMLAAGLLAVGSASALPLDFIYNGSSYGIMDITYRSTNSVQVSFTAATSVPGILDFQVTGFGFSFDGAYLRYGTQPPTVSNPGDATFTHDENSLDWLRLTNLNAIPNPANTDEVTKRDYLFGVTEGRANNINPPGIHPGDTDIFYLSGFRNLTASTDLSNVITLTGIRLQAIQPGGGSLFLTGTPYVPPAPPAIPEPGTLALLGLGLAALAYSRRRKAK